MNELTLEMDIQRKKPRYYVFVSITGAREVCPGETASYNVVIKNLGTEEDTYTIIMEANKTWIEFDPTRADISIPAAGKTSFQLVINVPPQTKVKTKATIKVSARGKAEGSGIAYLSVVKRRTD